MRETYYFNKESGELFTTRTEAEKAYKSGIEIGVISYNRIEQEWQEQIVWTH